MKPIAQKFTLFPNPLHEKWSGEPASKLLFLLALSVYLLIAEKSFAQQDPLYGLYINNPLVINPAYTGINNNLTVFSTYRNQWNGIQGSPTTLNAGGHISFFQNRLGGGVMMVSDKIGEYATTQVSGTFSYKLKIKEGTIFSFGMQGGFINYKIDPSQLSIKDPNDPSFGYINQMKPNLGAGLMLKSNHFLIGLSAPRMLNVNFNLGGQKSNLYQQHYYLFGSYLYFVSPRVVLKPSVLLKAVSAAPLSADVNLNVIFDRNYTVGVYTRNLNTYGVLVQLAFLEKFRLAYAFEVPTSNSVGTKYVTNELMLSIRTNVLKFHDLAQSNF